MPVFSPPLCLSPDSTQFLTPSIIFFLFVSRCFLSVSLLLECQFHRGRGFFPAFSQMYPRCMKNVPGSQ